MNIPLISVVVPIYKVEDCLCKCVESLINQTLENIEIILVDDGSPDNCPNICDAYAKQDVRIKVIHKKNGGLSDARNVGMQLAKGLYILFVDSDDYIISDACESLYSIAYKNDLDIVAANAIRVENHDEIYMHHADISLDKIMSGTEFLKEQLRCHSMYMIAWMNLYNKDFLINNEFFFKKGIYHEDEQWTPRVFLKANRVMYIDNTFYYYIIREDSITRKKNRSKNGIDLINTCYELESIYEKITDYDLKVLLNDYLVMLFLHAIHFGDLYDKKYSCIYDRDFLIGKANSKKNKIKAQLFMFNKQVYYCINRLNKFIPRALIKRHISNN